MGGVWHILKTSQVVLISFMGAAFSIMAFNNDVGVTKMFSQIYELITGTKSDGFTVLEFTYSIGIAIGILTFFNHFGKRRFSVDPTPIEVEMRLYENCLLYTSQEKERLTKEETRLNKEIARSNGMLNNEKFVSKAPAAKVQEEREKLEKYEQMLAQVKERLAGLQKK